MDLLRTAMEIIVVALLIIGLCNEPKIIRWEQEWLTIFRTMRRKHIGVIKLIKMYKEEYHK